MRSRETIHRVIEITNISKFISNMVDEIGSKDLVIPKTLYLELEEARDKLCEIGDKIKKFRNTILDGMGNIKNIKEVSNEN